MMMVGTGMRDFRSAFSIPEALERPSLVSNLADVRWQVRLGCQVQDRIRFCLGTESSFVHSPCSTFNQGRVIFGKDSRWEPKRAFVDPPTSDNESGKCVSPSPSHEIWQRDNSLSQTGQSRKFGSPMYAWDEPRIRGLS